jgi:hypothetical protein
MISCGGYPHFHFLHSTLQTSEFRFCSFKIHWHTVELIFSTPSLANIETRFLFFAFCLISTMNFEKATSYFSTSTPSFSQAYVLRAQPFFFQ